MVIGQKQDTGPSLSQRYAQLRKGGHPVTKLYPMPVSPEGSIAVRDVEWLGLSGFLRSRKPKAHAGETTRYRITNPRSSIQQ